MFDMSSIDENVKKKTGEGVVMHAQSFKSLKVAKPRTERFKKSLTYRGPKKWNNLPGALWQIDSRFDFKKEIPAHVEQKASVTQAT